MRRSVLALAVAVGLVIALPGRAELSGSSELMRKLMESPRATRADCIRALSVLTDGRKATGEICSLLERFKQKRWIRGDEGNELTLPASRGYASLLFMRAIGEKGGLLGRIFDSSEHLAYRHMCYLGLIPRGGSVVTLSGPELVSLVSLSRRQFASVEGPKGGRS